MAIIRKYLKDKDNQTFYPYSDPASIIGLNDRISERTKTLVGIAKAPTSGAMEIKVNITMSYGETFDIVICDWVDNGNGSAAGHLLQLNDLDISNSVYSNFHSFVYQNDFSVNTNITNNFNFAGLAYTNGFNIGNSLFHTVGTLTCFDANWVMFNGTTYTATRSSPGVATKAIMITQCGTAVINGAVTSIRIKSFDLPIANGSFLHVYKRL